MLKLYHKATATTEDDDTAFSNKESGDLALNDNQNFIVRHTWTETIANLGWAALDILDSKISRIAPGSANLSGDWGFQLLELIIPTA